MEEYLERTGEELEDGEDLGETTLDDGRTVFLALQSITPDWIKDIFFHFVQQVLFSRVINYVKYFLGITI